MATEKSGSFERALERLEQIVGQLERGDVALEASVELYREGRALAKQCEELLAKAQESIEAASANPAPPAPASRAEAQRTPPPTKASFFDERVDEDILDDEVPF